MKKRRFLTGVTTTGTLHLGNYVGAIKPAIEESYKLNTESFYFLADLHALIKAQDPKKVQKSRLEIAAAWIALGLDPDKTFFYRQSDIIEIPQLAWILTCVSPKGLLNRAHAYKAAVSNNIYNNQDSDLDINMGLFSYPILMAADILMFNADIVPVGKDQIQHLEMTRDIAARFNQIYQKEIFKLPEVQIVKDLDILQGVDGRKMSKSYDNTIALFASSIQTKKEVLKIITNSLLPGQAKSLDDNIILNIYKCFACQEDIKNLEYEFQQGLGWAEAKNKLSNKLIDYLEPFREKYNKLISKPDELEDIMRLGAKKARNISSLFLLEIMETIGFMGFNKMILKSEDKDIKTKKNKKPFFLSYKNESFLKLKLIDCDNELIFESIDFLDSKKLMDFKDNIINNFHKFSIINNQLFLDNKCFAFVYSNKDIVSILKKI